MSHYHFSALPYWFLHEFWSTRSCSYLLLRHDIRSILKLNVLCLHTIHKLKIFSAKSHLRRGGERDRDSFPLRSAPSIRIGYVHAWPTDTQSRGYKYSRYFTVAHVMVYKYKLRILYLLPVSRNQNYSLYSRRVELFRSHQSGKEVAADQQPLPLYLGYIIFVQFYYSFYS